MSEAKKYDRSHKEQSVKLVLEVGVKRASEVKCLKKEAYVSAIIFCFFMMIPSILSSHTALRLVQSGDIETFRVMKPWRVTRISVVMYIKKQS